jgi:TatD DNase family protein
MFFPDTHTHFRTANPYSILNSFSSINIPHSRGIHPWFIQSNYQKQLKILEEDLAHPKCIALGEAGLDKLCNTDFDIQLAVFRRQIELSENDQIPLLIHCVKASNELFQLKREINPTQPWIWHGFNKVNLLTQTLENSIIPSFGFSLFTHSKLLKEFCKLHGNQYLIETDNSTFSIEMMYHRIAGIINIPIDELQKEQMANFTSIFTKWHIG